MPSIISPQFLYMILVLPMLFGITLIGEGAGKLIHRRWRGAISIFFGLVFILVVILAYHFLSLYVVNTLNNIQ
jgi:hypothetical protein